MYSKTDIQHVRNTVDIVEFLEKHGHTFKQSGTSYVTVCPIHNEKSGSFNVRSENNTFHCFGCGAGGDVISLVQQMESLSFTGAIQLLAEEYDIKLESVESDPEYKNLQRLYRICQLASRFYREQYIALPETHPAKLNLKDRMLKSEGDKDLTIGFAPMSGLLDILFAEKFSKDEIAQTGLIKIGEGGKTIQLFRNRLIWTINDIQGRPIAFSARKIFDEDNGPKYINSPATRLYNKSKVLMGLDVAKKVTNKTQSIYVVEGATDIMAFRAVGYDNTVATCGTAFGTEHAQVALGLAAINKDSKRFKVYFCFDGDAAGLGAAKKVFSKAKAILNMSYVIKFDKGDPCDIRLAEGDDALRGMIEAEAVPIVEFMLKEELNSWDTKKPEELAKFVGQAKEILKEVESKVEQDVYLRKISTWTGVSLDRLLGNVKTGNTNASQKSVVQNSIYENLLAALVQFPIEIGNLFAHYDVKPEYFEDVELASNVFAKSRGESYDDTTLSKLLVVNVGDKTTVHKKTEIMLKTLLKALATVEINQLKVDLANKYSDEDESFLEFMERSQAIQKKYKIN